MRMPGFTADITINRGRKPYWLEVTRTELPGGRAVIPAAGPSAFSADCAAIGCITLCQEGDYGTICRCVCPWAIPPYLITAPFPPL